MNKFPKISDAKIKEGIFVGPQIRELMLDKKFAATMDNHELTAWVQFRIYSLDHQHDAALSRAAATVLNKTPSSIEAGF